MKADLTAEQFMSEFSALGASELAKKYGVTERSVYKRRRDLERLHDVAIAAPTGLHIKHPGRVPLELKNGTVLVGSDFHIWPGAESTCLRAFKKFVADIKPDAVILNGDVLDFPAISRWPGSWETAPDPQEEIEAAQDHLADIVAACKRGAHKIWTLGNHDHRFESTFANQTPKMRGVKGVHLADHFPVWGKAMSCLINEDVPGGATMVKHIPQKGGVNSTRNSTLTGGISTVNGHLHSQNVRPYSDYGRFDRYGVDAGMVADKEHRAFGYAQDNCVDWRSGFALLTYRDYRLLFPELVTKWDDTTVQFRGKLYKC